MPNLLTPFPQPLSEGASEDISNLWNTSKALIKELRTLLNNLDETNLANIASQTSTAQENGVVALSAPLLSSGTLTESRVLELIAQHEETYHKSEN